METFDTLPTGAQPGNQINSPLGTYGAVTVALRGGVTYPNSGPTIMPADQYSGGGSPYNAQGVSMGTGHYIVAGNNTREGNRGAFQLNLSRSANYFGLWWGAADRNNVLYFYNGDSLLAQYTTADVVSYSAGCKTTTPSCYGDPTANFSGQDSGEPFLYLNIFDISGTFNRIVFAEAAGTNSGFESDNHAAMLLTSRIPEPNTLSLFGCLGMVLLGVGIIRSRRKQ